MPIQTERGTASSNRTPDDKDVANAGGRSPRADADIIAEAIRRWNLCNTAEAVMRQEAMEDDKFKAGDQWPAQIRSDRTIQKRPCLTINKIPTFINQVTNEHKMNRPAINISPVGDRADPETAKMLKGMIRQIERTSRADAAYDWGFDQAVSGGWGFWRITNAFDDERSFNQSLRVERIASRFSVYMDNAADPIGTNAEWCFVTETMTRDEFKREYPDADPVEWQETGTGDVPAEWGTQNVLLVAEYYYFEYRARTLIALANGHIGYEDELAEEVKAEIEADPRMVKRRREVQTRQLKWCKLTAKEVLDRQDLPGKWIPVVRCIGTVNLVEGKVNYSGLVRFAKDAQRMYNYWCTAETELIALQPKAPWIMEEGQVEGHTKRWQQANVTAFPYLLYKGVSVGGKQAPAPQRQAFTGSPDGVVKAKIGAAQDMQATTGVRFDATLQERMNDESGRALVELKRIGEMGQYHFTASFLAALQHTGAIFIDLIKYYYDTRRALTILRDDDSEESAVLDPNAQGIGEENVAGEIRRIFNPNVGTFDVTVTTGPNFATKRQEAATQELEFLKIMPQAAPLVADIFAKNMDWPDADVIHERLASQLPPELLMKELKNMPPQARALVGSLQKKLQGLAQQHEQAVALLGDKQTKQQQEQQKIDIQGNKAAQDFEAKMAKIAGDLYTAQQERDDGLLQAMSDIKLAVAGFQNDKESAEAEREMERERVLNERVERETEREDSAERASSEIEELKALVKDALKKPKVKAIERVKGKDGQMARLRYDDDSVREVRLH